MRLTKYKYYKGFDINWLAQIPDHWSFDRIKSIGTVNGRVGWKALKASEYVDTGYFFLSTPNIKTKDIDYDNVNYITYERFIESPEIMLRESDVLLVKDGSTLGIVNIIKHLPSPGTVNSSIAVLRFKNQINRFIYYFLTGNFIQNVIKLKKEGMGVPHLFQRDINNFVLLLPPDNEQTQIANYLDHKTAAINKKIKLLEQKNTLYKQLRKSLINETICRGLDKSVKLKDSGIDWIGMIPEHWDLKRIKDIFHFINGYGFPIMDQGAKTKEVPFYKVSDINGKGKTVTISNNYVSKGTCLEKGWKIIPSYSIITAKIGEALKKNHRKINQLPCIIDNNCMAFVSKINGDIDFFYNQFLIVDFFNFDNGGTVPSVSNKMLSNYSITYPPINEQKEIANYLAVKTSKIDQITTNINKQVLVLKELRSTLINDVVTGKLKVTD